MGIVGLDHVQVAIPQVGENQARVFYAGLLGLQEVAKTAQLWPSGCWFTSGTFNLHLGVEQDFAPARKAHPALLVDDLTALRERLEAAGYPTRDDTPIDGYSRFFTQDPFGNRIELMQKL